MRAGRRYRIYTRIQDPELRQECEFSRIEESTTSNQSFVTKTQITTHGSVFLVYVPAKGRSANLLYDEM